MAGSGAGSIVVSGSVSQRYGSADPNPYQNVSPGHGTDYVHYFYHLIVNVKAYLTLTPFTVVSSYL